jgi:hypothetical protein
MIRFWNPNLFLGWSFWRFFKHPIFDNTLSELRWSDFDQLGSSGGFLTWVQTTELTNLAIDTFTLPT